MRPRVWVAITALVGLLALVAACRGTRPDANFSVQEVAFDVDLPEGSFVPVLEGPLRLLAASPYGATTAMDRRQPVAVTFSRPMVPLGDAPRPDPAWLALDPAVRGTLAWEGTQTLTFTPEADWPDASAFTVTLAPGAESLDGERLAEPVRWRFETPRPRLAGSTPASGEPFHAPADPLRLRFNQPIRSREAGGAVRIERVGGGAVRFRAEAAGDSALVLRPEGRLEGGAHYVLRVLPGVPSARGPLASADTFTVAFGVYGPLRLAGLDGPRPEWEPAERDLDPRRGVRLTFTTPVAFGDVRRAVSLNPSAALPPGIEAQDGGVSTVHVLPFELDAETAYTLRVAPGLTDTFGQPLAEEVRQSFRTSALPSSLTMPQGILVLEAEGERVVPVRATNVAEARVDRQRLSADGIVPVLRAYDREHWYGELPEGQRAPEPRAASDPFPIPLPRNRPGTVPLRLDGGPGVYALRLVRPGAPEGSGDFRAVAQVTRLSLSAKFSPHGSLLFVTELATAAPVAGARVSLRDLDNRVRWSGSTDASGRAEAPGWAALGLEPRSPWDTPILIAFAERDGDLAFTASNFRDGIEPYRFGLDVDWSPRPRTYAGSVFTDRGLYRAGETVHLKGILRTRTYGDWRSVEEEARLVVRDPRDEVVLDRPVRPSALGTFDLDWTPPAAAAQGMYYVRVGAPGDTTLVEGWSPSEWAAGSFRVDAFRRATFEVVARGAAEAYVAGDFFEGTISGRYLFGAPMGGQPVRYALRRQESQFAPPGFEAFRFGAFDRPFLWEDLAQGDTVLAEDGTLTRRLRLAGSELGLPTELHWEATVTDPARQELSGGRRITVHPGLFYVGLRPRTTYLDLRRESALPVDVITVDPAGAPVGGQTVTVELIRRQWHSVREVGSDGRLRWRSEPADETLGRQTLTTTRGRMTRLSLPVREGGSYVVRATSRDARGNAVRSEAYFWAAGGGYVAWERADDDRIDLIPEKTHYAPGETARLMVQSPYERATALVTVEREGILSSRVVTLEGSAPQIEVPLTDAHLPNAFVSVLLLHGRSAAPRADADPGAPSFKVGYATLRVDPGARRLRVEVAPERTTYRPGEEVTLTLRLVDRNGRGVPGEIAFSAADAGVLNLIGYRLPDPFDAFYGPRPLAVTTTVALAQLVRQRSYGQKEEDVGGGGGDRSDMMRRDFRPQAHWAPALQTDRSGRARVTFTLPQSLTTFRLMATGLTADHRFGSGLAEITVQQPLVLQAALPRFARLGDTFEAGVLVTNLTGSAGEATVSAEASGVVRSGGGERRVPLAAGETREVRFAWRVDALSETEMRFSARLGAERDALAVSLPVARPTARIVTGTFASTEGTASEALRIPGDALPGLGGLRVTLASTALAGLDGAARHLFGFPYGCLEQQTSRVRPLLLGRDLLDAFRLEVPGGDRDAAVRGWLAELERYWTGDGFAMWPGERWTNPYASAYAALALAEARDAGYAPPDRLTRDAVDWLDRTVRNRSRRPDFYDERVWDETRVLMLYALARHGRVLAPEIAALAERPLSPEGTALLLRTVHHARTPGLERLRAPLADRLRQSVRVEATSAYLDVPEGGAWGWIFASDTRATAYGLAALAEAAPSPETRALAEGMVRYLMRQQQGGHWASTQDNAAVVDAFAAFARAFEREAPALTAEVTLAGERLAREAFAGRTLRVAEVSRPLDRLARGTTLPLALRAEGTGQLYYTLQLETFSAAPQPARSSGLQVARTVQPLDNRGEPLGPALPASGGRMDLLPGQLVRVTLRLSSPTPRHYVVLDDALPAGLEALNAFFETSDLLTREESAGGWWGSFNHTEIRDDRVVLFADYLRAGEHTYAYLARATTPGTFVHPGAHAEAMYDPETTGRTASGTLVVAAP